MHKRKIDKGFIELVLISIAIFFLLILVFKFKEKPNILYRDKLRIGVGSGISGRFLAKFLESANLSFDVEPYYIQNC